jgi:hypothetical protein
MALEGSIKDFGLPDIFQLIGLQRKTGLLTLKNDKDNITVTFENGMVVMADSTSKRLEDRLGNVLVKQGKLGKEKLDEALQTQRQTLQRLGHILTTNNNITSKDLKEALQVQVSQIVFKVFRWRDGEYHFAPTDSVDYDRENFTPMSADFILMEGIRMVDEWPIIEKKIPSTDIVLRSVVDPSLIEIGAGSGNGDDVLSGDGKRGGVSSSNRIRLTPDEERIYRKVDGARSVQAIIDGTGLAEFEVCRTLFDLMNRSIIAVSPVRGMARVALEPGEEEEPEPSSVPGYVVMALVAALSVVGAFAQISSPFAVTGLRPILQGSYTLLLDSVSHSRLRRLDEALQARHLAQGALPRALDALVEEGLVEATYLKDPWQRPFHYVPSGGGYLLSAVDDAGKVRPSTVIQRTLAGDR